MLKEKKISLQAPAFADVCKDQEPSLLLTLSLKNLKRSSSRLSNWKKKVRNSTTYS